MQKTYSNVIASFIIFGSLATAKNSKIPTKRGALIGGKGANDFSNIFIKQIERFKYFIDGIPFDNLDYLWIFKIYYMRKNSDVSLDLLFDMLEYSGIITNDVTLRNYLVLGAEFDKEVPRVEITILEKKNGR